MVIHEDNVVTHRRNHWNTFIIPQGNWKRISPKSFWCKLGHDEKLLENLYSRWCTLATKTAKFFMNNRIPVQFSLKYTDEYPSWQIDMKGPTDVTAGTFAWPKYNYIFISGISKDTAYGSDSANCICASCKNTYFFWVRVTIQVYWL